MRIPSSARHRLRAITIAVSSIAAYAPIAAAQDHVPRVVVAGGLEAHSFDGGRFAPGYVGQLGLEYPLRRALAVRVSLSALLRNQTFTTAACGPALCTDPSGFGTSRVTAGAGEAMLVGRVHDRGVQVSVLAGVGVYRMVSRLSTYDAATAGWRTINDQQLSPALTGGVALALPLGGVTPFVELRAVALAHGAGMSNLVPVQVGVRF